MKIRLVDFLKQVKNRVSLFDETPSRANFLNAVAFLKTVRLIQQKIKQHSCVCKQN